MRRGEDLNIQRLNQILLTWRCRDPKLLKIEKKHGALEVELHGYMRIQSFSTIMQREGKSTTPFGTCHLRMVNSQHPFISWHSWATHTS